MKWLTALNCRIECKDNFDDDDDSLRLIHKLHTCEKLAPEKQ